LYGCAGRDGTGRDGGVAARVKSYYYDPENGIRGNNLFNGISGRGAIVNATFDFTKTPKLTAGLATGSYQIYYSICGTTDGGNGYYSSATSYGGGGKSAGYSSEFNFVGGGATDIRLPTSQFPYDDSRSRIFVAGGGGGSGKTLCGNDDNFPLGGDAGPLGGNGGSARCPSGCNVYAAVGGTQSQGGAAGVDKTGRDTYAGGGGFGVGGNGASVGLLDAGGGGGAGWFGGGGGVECGKSLVLCNIFHSLSITPLFLGGGGGSSYIKPNLPAGFVKSTSSDLSSNPYGKIVIKYYTK
jgi:hypothetical protein